MQNTSRMYVLDLIEAITNQIQLASHCQELLHYYFIEYQKKQDPLLIEYMDIQQELLDDSIEIRRRMMNKLKTENSDEKMWCTLKHAISAY
jgi:tRNA A37 threonylcarbamoyladenosine dehydratase